MLFLFFFSCFIVVSATIRLRRSRGLLAEVFSRRSDKCYLVGVKCKRILDSRHRSYRVTQRNLKISIAFGHSSQTSIVNWKLITSRTNVFNFRKIFQSYRAESTRTLRDRVTLFGIRSNKIILKERMFPN